MDLTNKAVNYIEHGDTNDMVVGGDLTPEDVALMKSNASAEELGYKKTNERSHGQPVYKSKKGKPKYITPDVDSHNGGVWKGADTVKGLKSKKTRSGTYDGKLNRLGD